MDRHNESNNYDPEPWLYCANCLSPKIVYENAMDCDCCGDCGSTAVKESTFDQWEEKYIKRYGHKYAEKNNDIRNSPVYKMSFRKLMDKVSNSPRWKDIIKEIYKDVPRGMSKADSIILFFSKLVDDNKLDKLREILYKWKI